jgi:hypothetical protein
MDEAFRASVWNGFLAAIAEFCLFDKLEDQR